MIDELRVVNNEKEPSYTECLFPRHLEIFYFHNNFTIKPYLRPMSSMTEEEKEERASIVMVVYNGEVIDDDFINIVHYMDWLNAHHFDFRNLIERGLAIAVTEENNPYKE